MIRNLIKPKAIAALFGLLLMGFAGISSAMIDGITGPTFNLTAKSGHIATPTGESLFCWGYANGTGVMQYPGPTLIVNEGAHVTITLKSQLAVPVSIIFPGQIGVTATGGVVGAITREIPAGNTTSTVTYSFIASQPGTFLYQSGTNAQLQTQMGLVGALIVRSATPGRAYDSPDSAYNREVLFMETEMDPIIHELAETGRFAEINFAYFHPVLWFLNGRNAPDTMAEANVAYLPHQPYNCMPEIHPGEKMLLRLINADRDIHPFHTHGNNMLMIAQDAMLLQSVPGAGADLARSDYTFTLPPGGTGDALFTWTGEKLGWDVYGHAPGDALQPNEYAPDHGKPFPVTLPETDALRYGQFYSGSPFLGQWGYLPSGSSLMNLTAGYFFMWHSHKEVEMVNDDVFPGGMMTMLIVEPPSVPIP